MGEATRSVSWGVVVLIVALGLFFVAAGVIAPGSEVPVASPMVVAMAGLVLAAGGIALMLSSASRLRLALVAVMLAGFAAIGGWIAFNGTAETISGGVVFLTREENALLGRLAFGIGAVLSVLVLILVLRQLRGRPDA
jgi:hypothetical protein